MIETWKRKQNMGHIVGVTYMDLSKAFDSLNHELLIAKLKCYGLDQHAVEFFRSYLSNRYQCCKINNTLGDWREIIAGVPQGSILGRLLFNIFLNDIFFFLKDANWFYDNYMALNPGKCHLMLFGVKEIEQFDLIYNDITLKHSSHENILGVTINNKRSFHEHIINIYETANKKLNTLSRINHYMK